jgi:hypothetical protein
MRFAIGITLIAKRRIYEQNSYFKKINATT